MRRGQLIPLSRSSEFFNLQGGQVAGKIDEDELDEFEQIENEQETQEQAQAGVMKAPRLLLEIKDGPDSDQEIDDHDQDIQVFHLKYLQARRLSINQACR